MFSNFFKTALRNLKKYKFYSILTIAGLALGISSSLIVLLYLQDELTWDRQYNEYDRIYRYGVEMTIAGETSRQDSVSPDVGPLLKGDIPCIEDYVTMRNPGTMIVKHGDNAFYESNLAWASEATFKVFNFKFIHGNPETCLKDLHTIVLTKKLAKKYFGDNNPLGETLEIGEWGLFQVTGVVEDLPQNTTISFDGALSLETLIAKNNYVPAPSHLGNSMIFNVYFLFHEDRTVDEFYTSFKKFYERALPDRPFLETSKYTPILEKLSDIRLRSEILPSTAETNRRLVYGVASLGVFILVLACINYINLSTSKLSRRSKEIGTRKVIGSSRKQLIFQLLGESFLSTFFALILSYLITLIVLKYTPLNMMIGKDLHLNLFGNLTLLFGSIAIMIITGLIAGLYPAIYFTRISAIQAIKHDTNPQGKGAFLRNLLVITQFVITIAAIALTILMNNQLSYMNDKSLGFDKDNIVVIYIHDTSLQNNVKSLKNEILKNPSVLSASLSDTIPGLGFIGWAFSWEENDGSMGGHAFQSANADKDYIDTLGLEIVAGEKITREIPSDSKNLPFLVNETLVKTMGWDNPIGKRIKHPEFDGYVAGVVKDFNFKSLHRGIFPLYISPLLVPPAVLSVKIKPENIEETISFIKSSWKKYASAYTIDYTFLSDILDESYAQNDYQKRLTWIFTYICIFISCLGLLGLTSFVLEKKTKEIGIRKVYGATTIDVVRMLVTRFVKFVLIANIFAWPLGYLLMTEWLQNFTYRTDITITIFVVSGLMALILAVVTVSFQVVKAALANPIISIHYE
ncbi:MAG: ABC transporter permease [Acidobacteria bacterium]|nr:ABC transporter permease [Acidobacteriota bacterium]